MNKTIRTNNAIVKSDTQINKWIVFAIIAFALLMMTIDSTIVATALHTLQEELHTSVSWAGWTMTAFSFGFVMALPLSAKLSTKYGHRRIFMLSVLIFTVASFLCGFSVNIYMLILMRIVQSVGAAGLTPSATGLIVEHFGSSRSQFLGLFGSIFSTGAMIGPIFGGLIVSFLSWPWIFYINIPLGILVLILSLYHIPKDILHEVETEKIDWIGLLLLGVVILSSMYAATYLAENTSGLFTILSISLFSIFTIAFYLLYKHLHNSSNPFMNPTFIFGKGFGAVNLFNVIHLGMVIGANSLAPLYAINRYGINEFDAGTLLLAGGIASVTMSVTMSILINRTGYRKPIYTGILIVITGIILLSIKPQFNLSPYMWLMMCAFLIGSGSGTVSPAGRNAGISLAPEQSANIAAVRSLGMQLGQIISIAGATSIIAASQNHGSAQGYVYLGLALFLLVTMPIISKIPENKGAW